MTLFHLILLIQYTERERIIADYVTVHDAYKALEAKGYLVLGKDNIFKITPKGEQAITAILESL